MIEGSKKRWFDFVPAGLFLVGIFLGEIWFLAAPEKVVSEAENRKLAARPDMKLEKVMDGTFQESFEDYLNDQFPARTIWLGIDSGRERMLGRSLVKQVVYAGDYLIEQVEPSEIDAGRAKANVRYVAKSARAYAALLGGEHVQIYLVPSKEDYLKDKLPAHLEYYSGQQLVERMEKKSGAARVIDCRKILEDAKLSQTFYYTDHHWTTEAAYAVYQTWCELNGEEFEPGRYRTEVVTDCFYGTTHSKTFMAPKADSIIIYRTDTKLSVQYLVADAMERAPEIYQMEELSGKNKYNVFLGGNSSVIQIHNENGSGRRLLMFKDSFANCFVPFLAEHYTDILMVDLRYLKQPLSEVIEEFGRADEVCYFFNTIKLAQDVDLYKLAESGRGLGDNDILVDGGDDILVDGGDDILVDDGDDIWIED